MRSGQVRRRDVDPDAKADEEDEAEEHLPVGPDERDLGEEMTRG